MDCSTPGFPVHHQLPELTQTRVHRVSDAIQPSHALSSPSPPAFNPSQHQGLFKGVSSLHQVIKYWSFSFSISPSNEHPGLISFRTDWLDSLQSKGLSIVFSNTTVKKYQFFGTQLSSPVQLSHPYMTTGKTIALTRRTFVGKVMSLLLICCLGWSSFSSKEQPSFNFMAAVTICSDFGAQENKVSHCFHCFPIYLP